MLIAARLPLSLNIALLLAVTLLGGAVGCANRVTPPADVADPATVFLVDYGRHAGLVLPRADEPTHVEYAYGDWSFFAIRNTNFFNGIRVLIFPTQGTLTRREYAGDISVDTIRAYVQAANVYELTVEHDRAVALADRLDARYEANIDTLVRSDYHMHYAVHDDQPYSILNTCNHVTSRWLGELGCDVRGMRVYSTWRIVQPDD